jgi:ketosteroid isomerase-like protein
MNENVKVLQAFLDAIIPGDADAAVQYVDENVVIHVGGRNSLAADYVGFDGFYKLAHDQAALTDFTLKKHPIDVLGGDTHCVVLVDFTASRDGADYKWRVVSVYRMDNLKIAEIFIYDTDQYVADIVYA